MTAVDRINTRISGLGRFIEYSMDRAILVNLPYSVRERLVLESLNGLWFDFGGKTIHCRFTATR